MINWIMIELMTLKVTKTLGGWRLLAGGVGVTLKLTKTWIVGLDIAFAHFAVYRTANLRPCNFYGNVDTATVQNFKFNRLHEVKT